MSEEEIRQTNDAIFERLSDPSVAKEAGDALNAWTRDRIRPHGQDPVEDRLKEALSWALGYIACNHPAGMEYPNFKNGADLLRGLGRHMWGEFNKAEARAELAEGWLDAIRKAIREYEETLRNPKDGEKT